MESQHRAALLSKFPSTSNFTRRTRIGVSEADGTARLVLSRLAAKFARSSVQFPVVWPAIRTLVCVGERRPSLQARVRWGSQMPQEQTKLLIFSGLIVSTKDYSLDVFGLYLERPRGDASVS